MINPAAAFRRFREMDQRYRPTDLARAERNERKGGGGTRSWICDVRSLMRVNWNRSLNMTRHSIDDSEGPDFCIHSMAPNVRGQVVGASREACLTRWTRSRKVGWNLISRNA